jgi:membrane protease YdiL (CAAX protease family)
MTHVLSGWERPDSGPFGLRAIALSGRARQGRAMNDPPIRASEDLPAPSGDPSAEPDGVSAAARPYGLAGLVASLLAFLCLTLLYAAAGAAVLALGDILIHGMDHLRHEVAQLMGAGALRRRGVNNSVIYASALGFYAAMILATLTLARLRGGRGWRRLLAWAPFRPDRAYWVLVGLAVIYGIGASMLVSLAYPPSHDWFVVPRASASIVVSFVVVVLAAPLGEELLFRGWMFTSLDATFGSVAANVVTATLFAVAHWERTHLFALAVFPLGLMLGYLRARYGSTRASAGLHAIYNLSAWILSFLNIG